MKYRNSQRFIIQQAIVDILSTGGAIKRSDLMERAHERTGIKSYPTHLGNLLTELCGLEVIERTGRAYYRLCPKGIDKWEYYKQHFCQDVVYKKVESFERDFDSFLDTRISAGGSAGESSGAMRVAESCPYTIDCRSVLLTCPISMDELSMLTQIPRNVLESWRMGGVAPDYAAPLLRAVMILLRKTGEGSI